MEPAEIALFLGETLTGGYKPAAFLSAGAFCGAFEAVDPASGAAVAIKLRKVSRPSPDADREFRDEVAMLRRLNGCDCVVDVLDSGQHTINLQHPATGGQFPVTAEFAVLELAAGSLTQLLLAAPDLGWPERLKLFRDVVKGIHQMHLREIVHRDLKAENVLLFEQPSRAKVADLGRAHDTSEPPRFAVEAYLMGRGDPRFAPLEFLWGQGTQGRDSQALADLYLLGSLFFEVATGVGITALITNDPLAIMGANVHLTEAERAEAWRHAIPWLRDGSQNAHETFALQVPAPIRLRATELLSLLTEPAPNARVPSPRGGKRQHGPWNLEWMLAWVDSMRRVIDPTQRRAYLAGRPRTTKSSRPRTRKL
ncbi:protein kinase family protein [Solirubrobacter phytolaccae]|uniref:Protein kinase family protein n=1 Tax=Solirubrobacter phytolaccae TaxID=1404360 RepID=A0A9X3S751_9ACTN|nr:protein kinase family protein [Solirubrobacter phytolaccae]MDA0178791.1 protein kinase family protein [Solirubrobacter phytolaccae]